MAAQDVTHRLIADRVAQLEEFPLRQYFWVSPLHQTPQISRTYQIIIAPCASKVSRKVLTLTWSTL
jgi:hypothetical protein